MNGMVVNISNSKNYITTLDKSINLSNYYEFVKRLFDIIFSIFGIIILIPLVFIIKIITVLSGDKDSIFFTQDRIGKNGEVFKMYKFRSMVMNADEVLQEILDKDGILAKEYRKNKKMKNDPRITKVGKLLRITSLDELPQVINILKGDMSIIGNRPYLPREKDDMGFYYNDIVRSKPGLTGFWQTAGNVTNFYDRLVMESWYSKNMNMKLDIKIFFKTFKAIVKGHGAGL